MIEIIMALLVVVAIIGALVGMFMFNKRQKAIEQYFAEVIKTTSNAVNPEAKPEVYENKIFDEYKDKGIIDNPSKNPLALKKFTDEEIKMMRETMTDFEKMEKAKKFMKEKYPEKKTEKPKKKMGRPKKVKPEVYEFEN